MYVCRMSLKDLLTYLLTYLCSWRNIYNPNAAKSTSLLCSERRHTINVDLMQINTRTKGEDERINGNRLRRVLGGILTSHNRIVTERVINFKLTLSSQPTSFLMKPFNANELHYAGGRLHRPESLAGATDPDGLDVTRGWWST